MANRNYKGILVKKAITSVLTLTILSGSIFSVYGEDNKNLKPYFVPGKTNNQTVTSGNLSITNKNEKGTELRNYIKRATTGTYTSASTSYDPRPLNYMTSVKNQQNLGICWAFAGISAFETYLLKNNMGYNDFSEEHMRWWAKGGIYNWDISDEEGSYNDTAVGYFTSWSGPKMEKDIPYNGTVKDTEGATKPTNFDSAPLSPYKVTDVMKVSNNATSIKNAILKYGSVTSGYMHSEKYIGTDRKSIYSGESDGQNHAIDIVGWNNNYPRFNFDGYNRMPNSNGAWLVKSSWGSEEGENGYYWISYEDTNIMSSDDNFAIMNARDSKNQKIYQHEYSLLATIFSNDGQIMGANKFKFGNNEILKSVMFYTDTVGAKYELYFVPSPNGVPSNTQKTFLKSGTVDHSGYTTIDINDYKLPSGYGSIAVKISNSSGRLPSLGAEDALNNSSLFVPKASLGESYTYENGYFVDLNTIKEFKPTNLSIKAITDKANLSTNTKLLSGNTRFETAIEIAKEAFPKGSDNVILVNSSAIADALTATSLAKLKDAPILLTGSTSLNSNTYQEIKNLNAKNITIIGGESSVSKSIEDELRKTYKVDRLAGNSRIETSEKIADQVRSMSGDITKVSVVNGYNGLPDAISFSPISGEKNIPILLTSKSGTFSLPSFIDKSKLVESYVLGGTSNVPIDVDRQLAGVTRLSGDTRNDTNAKIIEKFYPMAQLDNVFVAKDGYPNLDSLVDGLAVGVYAAKTKSPLVISHGSLSAEQVRVLKSKTFKNIIQVGSGEHSQSVTEILNMN